VKQAYQSDETEFIPTRQTLLSRLKDWGDGESWKDFFGGQKHAWV
jgi:hypothetical protein